VFVHRLSPQEDAKRLIDMLYRVVIYPMENGCSCDYRRPEMLITVENTDKKMKSLVMKMMPYLEDESLLLSQRSKSIEEVKTSCCLVFKQIH
jgi:hypothetical protein